MANVAQWVAQIRAAVYGEQVRESIARAIEEMNDDNIETQAHYDNTIEDVEDATEAATDAAEAATAIKDTVEEKLAHGDFIGATGPQGDAATIRVGTVVTGQPGSAAQVVNSGTEGDAVLDFTIPQGATGVIENLDTATVTFSIDTVYQNISSGMTVSGLFGRIQLLFDALFTKSQIPLNTTASAGTTDGDLYAAITALGWGDVIE